MGRGYKKGRRPKDPVKVAAMTKLRRVQQRLRPQSAEPSESATVPRRSRGAGLLSLLHSHRPARPDLEGFPGISLDESYLIIRTHSRP